IEKITGARSILETWTGIDSATQCSLAGSLFFGISGSVSDTPSATDSVTVTFHHGSPYVSDTPDVFRLPFRYASGSYQFGSPGAYYVNHPFLAPGNYQPYFEINAMGYVNYEMLPPVTLGFACDTTITGFSSLSLHDTLLTGPCVYPAVIQYNVSGTMAGYPTGADSAYLIFEFYDSSVGVYKAPITFSGTDYTFSFTCNHIAHTGATVFSIYAVTSTGQGTTELFPSDFNVVNCGYGSLFNDTHLTADACQVPDTIALENTRIVLEDSAMTATTVSRHVYFGDGTDTFLTAPVRSVRGYYFADYPRLTHTYTTPGIYTCYFTDSALTYTTYPGSYDITTGFGCSPVAGSFFIDANSNCVKDSGEVPLAYWPYAIRYDSTGTIYYGWADDTGGYTLHLINGYRYTLISDPFGSASGAALSPLCPASGTDTFRTVAGGASIFRDFAFTCHSPATMDMSVSGWGWGFVPGDTGTIGIWSSNDFGFMCDTLSADITLVLDSNLTFAGMRTGPAPVRFSGDTVVWHFTTTASLFDFTGMVKVLVDTSLTAFDTVHNRLSVTNTRITDPDTTNNTYAWGEQVRASYDPNEKQVSPIGFGTEGYIPNGTALSYIIHFQNTGSAAARNITVADTISTALDFSTLQVVSSSFPVRVYQDAGNVVKFKFIGINLPDSVSDPLGSIGYVAFNILPHDSLAPGTQIRNTSGIYFDYNLPVYTNTTVNTIEDTLGALSGPDSVCTGASVAFTARVRGGSWRVTNSRATVNDTGLVTGISHGTDTIVYTLYGHLLVRRVVNIIGTPALATITGHDTICSGSSTVLTASIPGGTWAATGTGIASVSAATVYGTAAGTDTVFYSVSNTCGSARVAYPVHIDSPVTAATITGASSVCTGSSIVLSASASSGTWRATSAHSTVAGGIVTGITVGSDTVLYTLSGACGNVTSAWPIAVLPMAFAGTITGDTAICTGNTGTVSASDTGGT
ncbi:MAG: hypothetical protein EBZ77_08695, partial [Chitinophagia bacterium]|nr:hypothetical protein [Chitinophagia bacterium]